MFAQIGLGDPTGGVIVLLVFGMLAVTGLAICVFGTVALVRPKASRYKSLLILIIGLVLVSPALWLAYELFDPDIPRDKSWDFSSSRSVARSDTDSSLEVQVRGSVAEGSWVVHVNVWLPKGDFRAPPD